MKWRFPRFFSAIAAVFVLCQSETVVQTKGRHFIMFNVTKRSKIFFKYFGSLVPHPAILKVEKALRTSLVNDPCILDPRALGLFLGGVGGKKEELWGRECDPWTKTFVKMLSQNVFMFKRESSTFPA